MRVLNLEQKKYSNYIMIFNIFSLETVRAWQYGFQIPASPVMEGIVNFHHDLFFFLTVIVFFVVFLLGRSLMLFNDKANPSPLVVTHAPVLEVVWTIIPALILMSIAIPSFSLLYSVDEIVQPLLTIKVIGHQWYWSYEIIDCDWIYKQIAKISDEGANYADLMSSGNISSDQIINYDSYMVTLENTKYVGHRLLQVDNKVYVPVETNVRLIVTSADVIHSWAVPALGIKIDACPGRLNQTALYVKRPGTFFGQCSEICGINHGFMPIAVTALDILGDGSRLDALHSEGIIAIFTFFVKKRLNI